MLRWRIAPHDRYPGVITVHHLEDSRSQRVLWLLEELGVPYAVRRYARDAATRLAPPDLRAVHPLGKSPVIDDDGRVIAETGAIVEYLVERHGGGAMIPPPGGDERLRYTYWLHFAEGSAMPMLVMTLILQRLAAAMPAEAAAMLQATQQGYVDPQRAAHLDLMEAELSRGAWFAGESFTAADVMLSFPVEAAAARGGLGERPRLAAWLDRIHARPGYRAALGKGGPYAYA
jgi:glutathione S-transferase